MAKAIASASGFLAAIVGKPIYFEVDGVTIELQGIGYADYMTLVEAHGDKPVELAFQMALLGIKAPKLAEADLELFRQAKPGTVRKIAEEVARISGLNDEGNGPLAGSTSPVP